jgi:hypothetical protein
MKKVIRFKSGARIEHLLRDGELSTRKTCQRILEHSLEDSRLDNHSSLDQECHIEELLNALVLHTHN